LSSFSQTETRIGHGRHVFVGPRCNEDFVVRNLIKIISANLVKTCSVVSEEMFKM
jgi:hypothetical protein